MLVLRGPSSNSVCDLVLKAGLIPHFWNWKAKSWISDGDTSVSRGTIRRWPGRVHELYASTCSINRTTEGGNREEVYLILKLMEDASDDMEDSLPTYRRIVIVANQGKSGLAGEKIFIFR